MNTLHPIVDLKGKVKDEFVVAFQESIDSGVLSFEQVNVFFEAIFNESKLIDGLEMCFDDISEAIRFKGFHYATDIQTFYSSSVIIFDYDFTYCSDVFNYDGFAIHVIEEYEPRDSAVYLSILFTDNDK